MGGYGAAIFLYGSGVVITNKSTSEMFCGMSLKFVCAVNILLMYDHYKALNYKC